MSAIQNTEQNPIAAQSNFPTLLTTSLVSSLIMLDSNVVAVALQEIGKSFTASFNDLEWVISAYVLSYAALLLAAGNLADRYGRKKAMLFGLSIFAVASCACGLAGSIFALNLARAVQGVGGALLLTSSLAIIAHTFKGLDQVRAFSVWGSSLGIALAIGPVVGGTITNYFGWRWIFLLNLPICALLIFSTFKFVAESRDETSKKLDLRGMFSFSAGLALVVWALIDGSYSGWESTHILYRILAGIACFAVFIFVERRQERPMVDLKLFKRTVFVGASVAMLGYGASAQVMIFFLPLYLQSAYAFSPMEAGIAMLPFALPMVFAPRYINKLAEFISGRTLLTLGLAISALGNLIFWFVADHQLSYPVFFCCMIIAGLGAGILNGQTVKALQNSVPPERSGMASGLASTTRFIGILLSIAGLGAVLSHVVRNTFSPAAIHLGLSAENADTAATFAATGDFKELLAHVPLPLKEQIGVAATNAFSHGFALACLLAAVIAILAGFFTNRLMSSVAAPGLQKPPMPCKRIDCRDPL